ncbi:hypothetical protein Tco_0688440 [Tanacetum coccineum]
MPCWTKTSPPTPLPTHLVPPPLGSEPPGGQNTDYSLACSPIAQGRRVILQSSALSMRKRDADMVQPIVTSSFTLLAYKPMIWMLMTLIVMNSLQPDCSNGNLSRNGSDALLRIPTHVSELDLFTQVVTKEPTATAYHEGRGGLSPINGVKIGQAVRFAEHSYPKKPNPSLRSSNISFYKRVLHSTGVGKPSNRASVSQPSGNTENDRILLNSKCCPNRLVLGFGCSKDWTGDRSQLTNFVSKFLGFSSHQCFIRNLEGVDLLMGSRGDNLYTLSLGNMMASSPICLLSKASKTKYWLWHRLAFTFKLWFLSLIWQDMGLVRGLPKLKLKGSLMFRMCIRQKFKKPHNPQILKHQSGKTLPGLHMDHCGPMRVAECSGKESTSVIVADTL